MAEGYHPGEFLISDFSVARRHHCPESPKLSVSSPQLNAVVFNPTLIISGDVTQHFQPVIEIADHLSGEFCELEVVGFTVMQRKPLKIKGRKTQEIPQLKQRIVHVDDRLLPVGNHVVIRHDSSSLERV